MHNGIIYREDTDILGKAVLGIGLLVLSGVMLAVGRKLGKAEALADRCDAGGGKPAGGDPGAEPEEDVVPFPNHIDPY